MQPGASYVPQLVFDADRRLLQRLGRYLAQYAGPLSLVLAAASALVFIVSVPARYQQLLAVNFHIYRPFDVLQSNNPHAVAAALDRLRLAPGTYATMTLAVEVVFALFFSALAVLVVRERSGSWWTRLVALTLALFGTAGPPTMTVLQAQPAWNLPVRALNGAAWTLLGLLFYLFPNGRFVQRWARPLALTWVIWNVAQVLFPGTLVDATSWPPLAGFAVYIAWFVTGVYAQRDRFRKVSTPLERQQAKWVALGLTAGFASASLLELPALLLPSLPVSGSWSALYVLAREPLSHLLVLLVPLSVALAILRYRLWEIDLFLNTAIVYVLLTAVLAGLYSAFLGLFQHLLVGYTGAHSETAFVMTTLVVTSALTPVKNTLQSLVERACKPEHDAQRDLLEYQRQAELLAEVLDPQRGTRRLLDLAVEATGAAGGLLYLCRDDRPVLTQAVGDWHGEAALRVSFGWNGAQLGVLELAPRADGQPYTEHDRRMLQEVADREASLLVLAGALPLAAQPAAASPRLIHA